MVPLKTNQIKEEILQDKASSEFASNKRVLKELPKTNFKKSFEQALTPEALRSALYKKVDDLWGK